MRLRRVIGAALRAPADVARRMKTFESGATAVAPGWAVVIITAGDDAPVEVEDQLGGDRLFGREGT